MSNEKFTKGPWFITEHGAIKSEHSKTATQAVSAAGLSCPMYDCEEAKSNAALIAAAPEMYEMLKRFSDNNIVFPLSMRNDMNALLAKARGE